MSLSRINDPINNINIIPKIRTEIKDAPNDNINIKPIINNYIRGISPSDINKKDREQSNIYYSPDQIKYLPKNDSKIKKTYVGINNLTINHKKNLTNLNLYFLYNTEDSKKNTDGVYDLPVIHKKKEPEDSTRKNNFESKNHPKDNTYSIKENNVKKKYHSIKYSIKRNHTKSTNKNKQSENRKHKHKRKKDSSPFSLKEKVAKDRNRNEPRGPLNLSEFTVINQIGKGTFGDIYIVQWKKNSKVYVLKKEVFNDVEFVEKRKKVITIILNFLDKTNNKGLIEIYSNLFEKNKEQYNYYELMELGDRDLDQEINLRRQNDSYYTEKELVDMASQLIKTLALMQKNHITHRDIKPQNILVVKDKYKLCDFGEIRIMERKEGIVVQRIRGSELYMSPILFYGLRNNMIQVKHNTYKSDVFSLGMCLLYAATMYFNCTDEIREMVDMNKISQVLKKYLGQRYSHKFIDLLYLMLQVEEQYRPDFIKLEEKLKSLEIV